MTISRMVFVLLVGFWSSMICAAVVNRVEISGVSPDRAAALTRQFHLNHQGAWDEKSSQVLIQKLYSTHLFSDVQVELVHGGVLHIHVTPRPWIREIKLDLGRDLDKKMVKLLQDRFNVRKGARLNASNLEGFSAALRQMARQMGQFNAQVTTHVSSLGAQARSVRVTLVTKGRYKIHDIHFAGSPVLSRWRLLSAFPIKRSHLWSFLTHSDTFSHERLSQAREALRIFYLDEGYLLVKVGEPTAVVLQSQEQKHVRWVDIHVPVTAGERYRLTQVRLAGPLHYPRAQVESMLRFVQPGWFSRRMIIDTQERLKHFYQSKGYAHVVVQALPKIERKSHTVKMTFFIEPGRIHYVRFIHFYGFRKTQEKVLRQVFSQYEGSVYDQTAIDQSLRKLRVLGYLKNVNSSVRPVSGNADASDLMVTLEELPSAAANVRAGYGTNGVTFGANLHQQDFLGTGQYFGLDFEKDLKHRLYSIDNINPYWTLNGIQQGLHFFSRKTTPGRVNLENYGVNQLGAGVDYRIPLGDLSGFTLGATVEHLMLQLGSQPSSQTTQFVNENGSDFKHIIYKLGWDYNSYDQVPLTREGWHHQFSILDSKSFGGNPLDYYKINWQSRVFWPLLPEWIASMHVELGYGEAYGETRGGLPFMENFFAGGAESIRGYELNTLGPKSQPQNLPLGGNALLLANVELFIPQHLSENVRPSLFIDAGNVYNTRNGGVDLSDLRYSVGIGAQWRVPMLGVLELSLAKTLNARSSDSTQVFQFSFGTRI